VCVWCVHAHTCIHICIHTHLHTHTHIPSLLTLANKSRHHHITQPWVYSLFSLSLFFLNFKHTQPPYPLSNVAPDTLLSPGYTPLSLSPSLHPTIHNIRSHPIRSNQTSLVYIPCVCVCSMCVCVRESGVYVCVCVCVCVNVSVCVVYTRVCIYVYIYTHTHI